MIYLLLTILCSTLLIIIFKALERFDANTYPVIVINYLVCTILGYILVEDNNQITEVLHQPWLPYALFLGFMFIFAFNLIGLSARLEGVTATAIAHKLSLVVPVVAAYFFYQDSFGWLKVVGIVLALMAVYLSALKPVKDKNTDRPKWAILLPLIVFIASGIVDATVNYILKEYLIGIAYDAFLIFLFGTAGVLGLVGLVFSLATGKTQLRAKELLWGILLGLPNYGSMYFVLKTLEFSGLQSSEVYPLVNIGVVGSSALLAVILFKERLSLANLLGLGLSIVAIILISWYKLAGIF